MFKFYYWYIVIALFCSAILMSCGHQINNPNIGANTPELSTTSSINSNSDNSFIVQEDSTVHTLSIEDDCGPGMQIIRCPDGGNDGGESASQIYHLKLNTPNFSFSVEDNFFNSDAIHQMHIKILHFFGDIITESGYALRDLDVSSIPGGGAYEDIPSYSHFTMNRKARFNTEIVNGHLNFELKFYDLKTDLKIRSRRWYSSDATINITVSNVIIKQQFDIATAQFHNLEIEASGISVDASGFPLGVYQSAYNFAKAVLGVSSSLEEEPIKEGIRTAVRTFYSDIDPNAFIANQLELLANYNVGPIDGIPAKQLLPILADQLRDFEASAKLYIKMPEGYPYRRGLVQLTLSQEIMDRAENLYYTQN